MGYFNDSDDPWRDDAEDRAEDAANAALLRASLVPLVIAVVAILIAGAGLAVTYVCALLSPGDLDGARWVVAIVFLFGAHLLAALNFDRFRRALIAGYRANHPVPSLRELLSDLNGRRAWLTRLVLALFALFAAAHLLATSLPTAVAVGIPVIAALSLDILALGTWRALGFVEWMGPVLRGGDAP